MTAKIKLTIVIDSKIDYIDDIEAALEKQRDDYREATDNELDIEWNIVTQDLSNLDWIEYGYGKDNYGVHTGWLSKDAKNKDGYSVVYVIDKSNWTTKGNQKIWGWSVNIPDVTHIQLIKGQKGAVTSMYYTFLMELMHSWDNTYFKITRKRLESIFMVENYDEDIVHGGLPEYTTYKYIDIIRKMKDILLDIFKDTMVKEEDMIGRLIKGHPDPNKIYWVRKRTKHHINSPEFFESIWNWEDVQTMSKEKFNKLEEGAPIGFLSKRSIIRKLNELIK